MLGRWRGEQRQGGRNYDKYKLNKMSTTIIVLKHQLSVSKTKIKVTPGFSIVKILKPAKLNQTTMRGC